MENNNKSKAQLINELKELRQQNRFFKSQNPHSADKEWCSQNGDKLNSAIVEHSPLGISVRSSKGKLLSVNNAWKKIWNLSDEQVKELMSKNPDKPDFKGTMDSLGEWLPKVENIYKNGGLLHIPKLKLTDKQCDRSCWVSIIYYAINNDKGEVDRVVILTDDITNRVNLERGILESQLKYRSLIDNANIGVLIIQDNRMVFCNSKIFEMFGYTEEEYSRIDFLSIIHPDDRSITVERIKARLSGLINDFNPLEIRAICKSGEMKWIETNSTKIQWEDKPALQAFICDITERKRAEENLKRYETIVSSSNDMLALLDKNYVYLAANEKYLDAFGLTRDEIIGTTASDIFGNEFFKSVIQPHAEKCLQGKEVQYQDWFDFPNYGKRYLKIIYDPYCGPDKRVKGFVVNGRDITEQKQVKDDLKVNTEKYRILVENLGSIIVNFALDGTIKYCSPNVKELGGYDPQKEIGQHFSKYIAEKDDLVRLQGFFDKVITGQKVEPFEFLYKPKDKKPFHAEAKARPVFSPDGNVPVSVSCIVNDISDRKKAQEELKKSEAKYRALFDLSGDAIMLFGKRKFINCNQAALNLFKCPSEQEFCNLHPADISPKLQPCGTDSIALANKQIAKAIKNGYNRFEWMHQDLNGNEFPAEVMLSAVDLEGHPSVLAIVRDITERKQAEDALKEKEYFLRESQKVARLGNYVHNIKTGIWTCSEVLNEIYGLPADYEKTDESWLQIVHPDDRQHMSDYYFKFVLGQKQPFNKEYRIIRYNDKKQRWVHGQSRLEFDIDRQPIRMIGTVQDITERKQAENSLNMQKQKLDYIIQGTNVGTWEWNVQTGETTFNERWANIIGYTLKELAPVNIDTWMKFAHPDDLDKSGRLLDKHFKGELNYYECEARMRHKNGDWIWVLDRGKVATWTDDGKPLLMFGTHQDITKQKRDSEELIQLAEVVQHSSELVNMSDLEGKMIFLNRAGGKMLGIDPEDVGKTNIMEVIPDNLIDTVKNSLLPALMNGEHWEGDLQYRNLKTGKLTDVHAMTFTVNDPKTNKPKFLANVSIDITETKRLQEQESRSQRLESAGQVAGQIAHDFNNLLAPLVAYPDFIKEALPKNHPALKYIDDMERSANQIAEINQQLLTLSRRGHYNQETLNLNDIISHVLREMEVLPQTVVVQTDLKPNLMNIKGGGAQIHRILTNLICNARDAMQNVGNIVIKTENYYSDNLTINYGSVPKGEYVKLTISDNGCGIPENIRFKIFDPFFSTKTSDKKRGSGLGLSVVDTVIKDHNGYIDLKSTIGEGTSFFIYFPITRDRVNTAEENNIIGGTESIIVIDDDEVQCNVALKILEKLGYKATAVNSGDKAVEYLKNNPHNLLLLDMIMPDGIDGTETYRQILEIYPDQKAIMVSGYAETSRVEEARQLGIDMYIRKPLTMKLLASCIRKVLDKKKESLISA